MDMRAEHTLGQGEASNDRRNLKFIVFGGILGDHPPQDRAKSFREDNFKVIRNLGKTQMTTDTALLVSYEIMEHSKKYSDMKFVDDPEVSLDSNPFLDKEYNIEQMAGNKVVLAVDGSHH